ncbi:SDR family oxidoreductase [Novosphingobium sp. fls2-241-R2A-195]|uniref:SDR family oxidoreductase n=1 Tax=Novosphingobium sp. fls2-241-R2A-195 TaxID=3040296 RepID=UPI00254FBD11|nr:SDR family oxidoreductase [Novosphingobium sp. fls2-241-R2A-195]
MSGVPGRIQRPDLPLAVVIGAGGMGLAVARRMAQTHRVLLADIDGEAARAQADSLARDGADVHPLACDVTDTGAVAALSRMAEGLGGFRCLVHVAGLSIAADDFARILAVNLRGPALVATALRPLARPGASAILIASLAAHSARPSPALIEVLAMPAAPDLADRVAGVLGAENATPAAAYALSKVGLLQMARREAADWGRVGARIVSLSPGLIATPMGALAYEKSAGKRAMFAQTPLSREGAMSEIADAVEFLASDRASFISGTDLLVDGGLSAALGYPQG